MKRYVAGLDGGGTKTAVMVADEQGKIVHAFTSGAINYNGQDEESIRRSFKEIIDGIAAACGGLEYCVQIVIGAAGVSNPTVSERLTSNVRECGYMGGLSLVGDQETALVGAHEGGFGAILIAGTGSICYGQNAAGLAHRAGGYGYLIDDEGSGYSIGRDMLSALVRASDGRLAQTLLTDLVYKQLQITSVQEIVGFVYSKETNKKDIAAIAPLLTEACEQGDETALSIAVKSAHALVELVIPVVEKLSLQQGNVAMAGSVLLKNSFIQRAFVERLRTCYPELTCIPAKKDAAEGAVIMALRRLNAGGE